MNADQKRRSELLREASKAMQGEKPLATVLVVSSLVCAGIILIGTAGLGR